MSTPAQKLLGLVAKNMGTDSAAAVSHFTNMLAACNGIFPEFPDQLVRDFEHIREQALTNGSITYAIGIKVRTGAHGEIEDGSMDITYTIRPAESIILTVNNERSIFYQLLNRGGVLNLVVLPSGRAFRLVVILLISGGTALLIPIFPVIQRILGGG